jgi:hypothetical protein
MVSWAFWEEWIGREDSEDKGKLLTPKRMMMTGIRANTASSV